jgi:hypothetical protein
MTFRPDEMRIVMHCGSVYWMWVLEDMQGEAIEHGQARDYHMAAQDALIAFNKAQEP